MTRAEYVQSLQLAAPRGAAVHTRVIKRSASGCTLMVNFRCGVAQLGPLMARALGYSASGMAVRLRGESPEGAVRYMAQSLYGAPDALIYGGDY
jgi:hypothetical protein